MLQQLFNKVGFGWAVRISAFVCLACGIIATVLVSSRLPKRKPGPWVDVSSLKDANYAIFVLGSAISCLGKLPRCLMSNILHTFGRYFRADVLHRTVCPRLQRLPDPRIRGLVDNERRKRVRTHRAIHSGRSNWKVQHVDSVHSSDGNLHSRIMVPRTGSGDNYHIFRVLRILLWKLVRTANILHRPDFKNGKDWSAHGNGV